MVQKILYLQDYDLENEVKITKIQSALKLVAMIYPCKFGENLSTYSKYIPLKDFDLEKEVKATKD